MVLFVVFFALGPAHYCVDNSVDEKEVPEDAFSVKVHGCIFTIFYMLFKYSTINFSLNGWLK